MLPIAAHKTGVNEKAQEIINTLTNAGVRCEGDFSDQSAGWKFNQWEMKGVPLRLEVGPRDIENGVATLARRDNFEKITVKIADLDKEVPKLLNQIQNDMLEKARVFRDGRIKRADSLEEMKKYLDEGNFVMTKWCGCRECEDKVKELMQASSRIMPLAQTLDMGICPICGKQSGTTMIWARAY